MMAGFPFEKKTSACQQKNCQRPDFPFESKGAAQDNPSESISSLSSVCQETLRLSLSGQTLQFCLNATWKYKKEKIQYQYIQLSVYVLTMKH